MRSFRYFAPLPTHSDLCLSAEGCTGNRMHSYKHRTPQHTNFPSFTSKTTSRVVREPHLTHGNKTRICSFTDSRTTICAPCHTLTPTSAASPLVSPCLFTPTSTIPQLQRVPPVIRVTALPRSHVCYSHPVYYSAPLPRSRVFRVSLFRSSLLETGFTVTPPEPGPAPSPASVI